MSYTAYEVEILKTLINKIPVGGIYEPDLYMNEDDYLAIQTISNKAWDESRYPGRFKRTALIRQAHKYAFDRGLNAVNHESENTSVGFFEYGIRESQNEFSATAFAAVSKGFHTIDMTLILVDEANGRFVNAGTFYGVDDVYGEFVGKTSLGLEQGTFTAMLHASWSPQDGSAPRTVFSKVTHSPDMLQSNDPSLTHPVRRSNTPMDPFAISIGLGRPYTNQGPGSDMDYAWNQSSTAQPKGLIPFVGSARFSSPIIPLQPKENFIVQISVANRIAGGGYFEIKPENMNEIYNGFEIDINDPNVLKWDFRPSVNTSDRGNPIAFENIKWPSQMRAMYYFKALVFLRTSDGLAPGVTMVRSHDGTPQNPQDGLLPILPISFVFHCLAKDCVISMGDGSKKQIQNIVAGDKVLSDLDDGPTEVLWTTRGNHSGLAYRIETKGGHCLEMTEDHIVVTEIGMKMARELIRGEMIFCLSNESPSSLEATTIERIITINGYDEEMFNIAVEPVKNGKRVAGIIFANDLCVGDASATEALEAQRRTDYLYLKSVLPYMYHTDLQSYFEDLD